MKYLISLIALMLIFTLAMGFGHSQDVKRLPEDQVERDRQIQYFREVQVGSAVGPVLPIPKETPTLEAKLYRVFGSCWNVSIRVIPPSKTWHGHYWAKGRP